MKMESERGKKLGLTVLRGGKARTLRPHAEVELERAVRALFYAMEGKGKNLHNVAEGVTHPMRMLLRRLKEAKRARRDQVNYPLAKATVRELDRYVDALFYQRQEAVTAQRQDLEALLGVNTTGEHPKAA